jgi:hypothetical protein
MTSKFIFHLVILWAKRGKNNNNNNNNLCLLYNSSNINA